MTQGDFMKKIAHNRVDMVGKIYNSWKVLGYSHTNGKIPFYKCECLECNTEHVVDGRNVRSGQSKRCLSCGNINGHDKQKGTIRTTRSPKEVAEHYLLNTKKTGARKRGYEWSITKADFVKLIYDNCYYCGTRPSNEINPVKWMNMTYSNNDDCIIKYNGLDRIDSTKGYLLENVVTCCYQCNTAKMDYTQEEFLQLVNRIAKRHPKE